MKESTIDKIRMIIEENRKASERATKDIIEKEVQKHIKPLEDRFNTHLTNIEPFLSGLNAGKIMMKFVLWLCGGIVALGSAVLMIKELLK